MEEYYLDIHTRTCSYKHNANDCCLFDYAFPLFIKDNFYLVKTNKCILGMEYGCRIRDPTDVAEGIINIMNKRMGANYRVRRSRLQKQLSFQYRRLNNYGPPDSIYQLNYVYGCGQYGVFTEIPFLEAIFMPSNDKIEINYINAKRYEKDNRGVDYNGTQFDIEEIYQYNKIEPLTEKEMNLGISYLIKQIYKEINNRTIYRF